MMKGGQTSKNLMRTDLDCNKDVVAVVPKLTGFTVPAAI